MTRRPPHVVEHDALDRAAWARVTEGAPGLLRLGGAGAKRLPDFPTLVEDLFYLFYKGHAQLRDDVPPSGRVHQRVLREISGARGFEATRARTFLDEWSAAAAAQSVGEDVLAVLRSGELLLDHEVLEHHRARHLEERLAEAEAQQAALAEMRSGRPLEDAAEDLEADLEDEIEALREALDEAEADARNAAKLAGDTTAKLRQAIDGVPDKLQAMDADVEAFGRSMGTGQRLDAAQRLALGEQLLRSEKLRKLSLLVGAFRQLARLRRKRRIPRRATEVYGVSLGADPARLLPSELSALRHPLLRKDVRRRFVEGRLLQYDLSGPDDRGRGPIVVCLDSSGSMAGPKELWSKALALTLLEEARRKRRAFRVIQFSAPPQPLFVRDLVVPRPGIDGRRPVSVEALVELAEHFQGGGTDFQAPLDEALKALADSRYRKGDIVFLTDGECQLGDAFLDRFADARRRLGFRVHGVLVDVGHTTTETLARFADELHRVTELTGDAAIDIVEGVR